MRQLRSSRFIGGAAILCLVIALPLAGAALAGRDLGAVFRFPPRLEIPSDYVRFSWVAAAAVIVVVAALAFAWGPHLKAAVADETSASTPARFPAWGWAAVGWTLVWWALAWTRLPWFEPLQRLTFFPLWLGFIVTVNALTQRRTGTCLMRRAPRRWLALFATSAAFWWLFEWLNRFVRNWHYLDVEDFGAFEYALHATVCFSTVLPAVAAVAEWLSADPRWRRRVQSGPVWRGIETRAAAKALWVFGAAALMLTGAFPQWFYPALWVAPLALLLGEPVLAGRHGVGHEMARGDWTRAATWMSAALICGFFWELWNWHSAAKWIYTVPGVQRWHVFEMPLLGYAGYLPFGLECLLVVERILGRPPKS